MSELRMRPKSTYILNSGWNELHVLTQHWISDLHFYGDDLKFFHHLIDKYFIWINEKEHLDEISKIKSNVQEMTKSCSDLLKRCSTHLSHIEAIIEDPFPYNSQKFREEHQALEDEISNFVKACRNQRKELFSVIEHLVESERFQETIT